MKNRLEASQDDTGLLFNFEDFSVDEIFDGSPHPVNLSSHPGANMFRTRLTHGAPEGPNFAGHYTVVKWGCGSNCLSSAVVDAKTGNVYFHPDVAYIGVDFRIDSNLFIINPPSNIKKNIGSYEQPEWLFPMYYEWENNEFILLESGKEI